MIEIDLQALSKLISYTHILIYSYTHILIYSYTHILIYSYTHILIYYLLNQVYTGPHSVNFEWFITTFIYNNRG